MINLAPIEPLAPLDVNAREILQWCPGVVKDIACSRTAESPISIDCPRHDRYNTDSENRGAV